MVGTLPLFQSHLRATAGLLASLEQPFQERLKWLGMCLGEMIFLWPLFN